MLFHNSLQLAHGIGGLESGFGATGTAVAKCRHASSSSKPAAAQGLIMGPPGGGKGTIAKRITRDFGFEVLSSGDLIRAQIAQGSDIGREFQSIVKAGKLVPDEVRVLLFSLATRTTSQRLTSHVAWHLQSQ